MVRLPQPTGRLPAARRVLRNRGGVRTNATRGSWVGPGVRMGTLAGVCWYWVVGYWVAGYWVLCGWGLGLLAQTRPDDPLDFSTEVLPLLQRHCYACHSHQAGSMEGNLALDWRSGWETGGDRGPAIVPGQPDDSLLVQAIRHTDPDLQMPAEKIPAAEIAILERWIQQGAADPRVAQPQAIDPDDAKQWWSLQPLIRPTVPEIMSDVAEVGVTTTSGADARPAPHPIDVWIDRQLAAERLQPQPLAERRELIRRLWFDLLGLQPTVEEVAAFEQDSAPDAWQRLVDECLSRPQYAERWARHWLDTVHFADSHGFEHDVFRPHAWPYRDYVIDALHRDMPWSDFIKAQLAADYFFPDQPTGLAALGFLGAGPYDQSAAATAPLSFEYLDRDDLVTQVCGAFLSVTANCARCHAHKFDPISQEDYFALQATFAGILKGEIRYDADPSIAAAREHWQAVARMAAAKDEAWLGSAAAEEIFQQWAATPGPRWLPLDYETFHSSGGAQLQRLADGSLLSTGPAPDKEELVVTATSALTTITAFRLDLLTDESLPQQGPGRAPNGNLHLNDIRFQYFAPDEATPRTLAIAQATADFNQEGWTIQQAIDDNPGSAWGIHPHVGQPHHAIFVLTEPLEVSPQGRILISLKQTHGGGHVIGRCLLSACDGDANQALALSADSLHIEQLPAAERTAAETRALRAEVLQKYAEQQLRQLPEPDRLYAAGKDVENERGRLQVTQPRTIQLLARGDLEKPRGDVGPGALSIFEHLPARFAVSPHDDEALRRAELARWIVHPENPLTWRSMANRVWYYHFGRGLCNTPNDFGRMGELPTHPELLDWLACELRDTDSLKHLHRLICTSQAYRRSSRSTDELTERDPENRWLARGTRRRLDAESFRDSVLGLSGALDLSRGGPGIKYFRESPGPQVTPKLHYDDFDWDSPGAQRRSIYRVVWRGIADPLFEALDFPDLGLLAPQRHQSSSPLQALVLLNHPFVLHHAQRWATALSTSTMPTGEESANASTHSPNLELAIQRAVRQAWLRAATEDELSALAGLAREHGLATVCRLLINSNEFLYVE